MTAVCLPDVSVFLCKPFDKHLIDDERVFRTEGLLIADGLTCSIGGSLKKSLGNIFLSIFPALKISSKIILKYNHSFSALYVSQTSKLKRYLLVIL